jgi:hypothetical protein
MGLDALDEMLAKLPQLRAEHERLSKLIAALEAYAGDDATDAIVITNGQSPSIVIGGGAQRIATPSGRRDTVGPDQFVGLSTSEAIRAFLAHVGRGNPQGPRDMAKALVAGGRASDEEKEYQNVASALKRMNKTGEVRQVRRGQWGLGSWYGPQPAKKGNGADD